MFPIAVISTLLVVGVVIPTSGYPSNQPVIGVLLETVLHSYRSCHGQYKVLSSYQSFIEQGSGGVVPIFVNQPDEYYEELIPRLNGALLTGGGVNLITSPYGQAAYKIYKMATELNDAGVHFPIWGTCLGMQEMTTWPFNPRTDPLTACSNTEAVSLTLNFTSEADSSKLFGNMPDYVRQIITKEAVTPNYHHSCLATKMYETSQQLNKYYSVLSTNHDGVGLSFVSTFEARKYPFFGVQWHPEKNNFLHPKSTKINQSMHAALISQYFGNFLVDQARQNNHTFKSEAEESRFLINRYPRMFDGYYEYFCFSDSDVPKFDSNV